MGKHKLSTGHDGQKAGAQVVSGSSNAGSNEVSKDGGETSPSSSVDPLLPPTPTTLVAVIVSSSTTPTPTPSISSAAGDTTDAQNGDEDEDEDEDEDCDSEGNDEL